MILVAGAVQVLFAGITEAQASNFIDYFDALDMNRWSKGDYRLDRGYSTRPT